MKTIKIDIEKMWVKLCERIEYLHNHLDKEAWLALPLEKLYYIVDDMLFDARKNNRLFINTKTPLAKCPETKLHYLISNETKYYFIYNTNWVLLGKMKSNQQGYNYCYEFEKN